MERGFAAPREFLPQTRQKRATVPPISGAEIRDKTGLGFEFGDGLWSVLGVKSGFSLNFYMCGSKTCLNAKHVFAFWKKGTISAPKIVTAAEQKTLLPPTHEK
jgi:hypothetical protein